MLIELRLTLRRSVTRQNSSVSQVMTSEEMHSCTHYAVDNLWATVATIVSDISGNRIDHID